MKKGLSGKNKIFIILFILIILVIVGILVYSVTLVNHDNSNIFSVDANTILFADDYSSIDTTKGGKIEKKWNNVYSYVSNDNQSYVLGDTPVAFNSANLQVTVIGDKYQVLDDGSVVKSSNIVNITNDSSHFYKLQDREYLIISKEISDENKTVYTKKYLLVFIDKQGNASLLNDALNVHTINPIKLMFDDYIFDVANEKLIIKDSTIDLKQIIGSTNEYVEQEKKEKVIEYDTKELLDSYNELVNDFGKYAKNHNYTMSANNQVSNETTNIIINNNAGSNNNNNNNSNNNSTNNNQNTNKTEIMKRVSLRGVVTSPSYIDVSYSVTDPENRYQAVYLLVTGNINNKMTTEKIVIDKYDTKYRITGVAVNNEYTISLGYIEIILKNEEKSLNDNIEDVINVRTKDVEYNLKIEKISSGKVYYNYKMSSSYAFETCDMAFIVDGEEVVSVPINHNAMISKEGFSSNFDLTTGNVYELRVKNGKYNGFVVDTNIYYKFTLTS